MLEIMRIAGGAVVRVLPGEVIGVFAHVERADEDGVGAFEARNQGRIPAGRRPLAVDLRAGACRQTLDVEQILDGERRAGEWPKAFAASARGVDRLGLRERARRSHIGERAERAVARFDARERRFGYFAGARRAAPDGGRDRLAPSRQAARESRLEHRRRLFAIVERRG